VQTPIVSGPGDRTQTTKVRVHYASLDGSLLTARVPLTPGVTQPVPGPAQLSRAHLGRAPDGRFDADQACALFAIAGALSSGDVAALASWARRRHGAVTGADQLIVFVGDSLTGGEDMPDVSRNYPTQLIERRSLAGWDDVTLARGGKSLAMLVAYIPVDVSPLLVSSRRRTVAVVFGGTNDFAIFGASAREAYDALATYCRTVREQGWRVVAVTMLPRSSYLVAVDAAEFERRRLEFNALVRAGYATFADALADAAADASIGQPGASASGRFYLDGTHLTADGCARLAAVVESALPAVVA
jgi:lysophospholipase L1-like esterase